MLRTALPANRLSAFRPMLPLLLSGIVQISFGAAQSPHGHGPRSNNGPHIQMLQVPFPFVDRTVKFHAPVVNGDRFIQMAAAYAVLPKGFDGKLRTPQNAVQLGYGYKQGGIVRIYETPKVPGISANQFLSDLVEAHVFRDINGRPGYKFTVVPDKNLFIAITYTNRAQFDLAKSDMH